MWRGVDKETHGESWFDQAVGALMRLDLGQSMAAMPELEGPFPGFRKDRLFMRKRLCALHLEIRRDQDLSGVLHAANMYLNGAGSGASALELMRDMLGEPDAESTRAWSIMRRAMVPADVRATCLYASIMHTDPVGVLDACTPEWVARTPRSVVVSWHHEVAGLRTSYLARMIREASLHNRNTTQ